MGYLSAKQKHSLRVDKPKGRMPLRRIAAYRNETNYEMINITSKLYNTCPWTKVLGIWRNLAGDWIDAYRVTNSL
jgi:hypothetical protein